MRALEQADDRALVLVDARGTLVVPAESVAKHLAPIDSPEKAALAAWSNNHELTWRDGDESFGNVADAKVRETDQGFYLVFAGEETEEGLGCGAEVTTNHYRVVLRVYGDGRVDLAQKDRTGTSTHIDQCHRYGRRPEGFVDVPSEGTTIGHFARAMHHEAESVRAFTRLARELEAHGAPVELVDEARRAAGDERRHAFMFARLLRGTQHERTPTFAQDDAEVRSLAVVAMENAREGCVMETFAAAVAVHQSLHAESPTLRDHYGRIARDELRHAALAHAIDEWATRELGPRLRRRLAMAKRRSRTILSTSFDRSTPMPALLGMPEGPRAHRLLQAIRV